MKRPYWIMLTISICLMSIMFLHDAIYDDPGKPYPLSEMISDLLTTGVLVTGCFFIIMSVSYYLIDQQRNKKTTKL
jgi:hypothetical protein